MTLSDYVQLLDHVLDHVANLYLLYVILPSFLIILIGGMIGK